MLKPPVKTYTNGSGKELSASEWKDFRNNVYEYLFYVNKKWESDTFSVFYNGHLIHYSDFMKAKRGSL